MNVSQLKFPSTGPEFFPTVTKRVSEYFKVNNISRQGNSEMVVKSIFMFSLYFIPYFFILSTAFAHLWVYFGLFFIMGLGKAGIGLSIMHDANHNAYSKKAWINNLMGASLNIVGGHSFNWIVQHNVLHHTYTNIHGADEDITPRGALRMSPESEWKPMHRYQHVYSWFLYGLQTFVWIVFRDFARLARYQKEGFIEKQKSSSAKEWVILIATKVFYFSYMFVIPLLLTPLSFIQIFLGFVIMHYVTGFILAIIFQPAHVIEGTAYPVPDKNGNLENNWAVHQMYTTTNFGHREKLFSWYVGGLNYQVEHHLFPNVCHVHYRKIAPIVKKTAEEFGVPYKSVETFMGALRAHGRLLKSLGQKPPVMKLA